ncbi:unnamed protein product [Polarella glacialis]|uniref:AB hydrolase-1 domain-containing protein n=1 Tax=Polarella glacialis TaxID=89957 RepID=A0A813HCJ8_POLGL|nr:unnamed protein product [Polarella glacialis]
MLAAPGAAFAVARPCVATPRAVRSTLSDVHGATQTGSCLTSSSRGGGSKVLEGTAAAALLVGLRRRRKAKKVQTSRAADGQASVARLREPEFEVDGSGRARLRYEPEGWSTWGWGAEFAPAGVAYAINYVVSGPVDGIPVLLVHGFGASSYHWRYQVPSLAEQGFRVYSVCLLGYGWSPRVKLRYSLEEKKKMQAQPKLTVVVSWSSTDFSAMASVMPSGVFVLLLTAWAFSSRVRADQRVEEQSADVGLALDANDECLPGDKGAGCALRIWNMNTLVTPAGIRNKWQGKKVTFFPALSWHTCVVAGSSPESESALKSSGFDLTIAWTFYIYRAENDHNYPLEIRLCLGENVNAANLAGDLGMNFGTRFAFDSGKCTGPGTCYDDYVKFGFSMGCNYVWEWPTAGGTFAAAKFYDGAAWYSLPGPCPHHGYNHHDHVCAARFPGGGCPGTPTGQGNCTYSYSPAGEIRLDELVGINDYAKFVKDGGKEYGKDDWVTMGTKARHADFGHHNHFWDHMEDAAANKRRVGRALELFKRKYGNDDLPDPRCNLKSIAGWAFYTTKLRIQSILESVYVNREQVDEDLVTSIRSPADHPDALDTFGEVIQAGRRTQVTVFEALDNLPVTLPVLLIWGMKDPW